MKRLACLRLVVAILGLLVGGAALGKGRPWIITDITPPTGSGWLVIMVSGELGGTPNIPIAGVVIPVPVGISIPEKTDLIASYLSYNINLDVQVPMFGEVRLELRATSAFSAITGITIMEFGTGEELIGIEDDPEYDFDRMVGFLTLSGVGHSEEGMLRFRIGDGDLIEVPTFGREPGEIMEELVGAAYDLYGEYEMEVAGSTLVMLGIPCPLGATVGVDDPGLNFIFGMRVPDLR